MYINHINKYEDSQAIQDALNEGSLANPYVAYDEDLGELDYNSLEPQEECYIGEWSVDEQGEYTFQILDTGDTAWENGVNIGTLEGVYSDGNHEDLDITLNYNSNTGYWHMEFFSETASNIPEFDFEDGVPYTWESGAMTALDDSDAVIRVDWDDNNTFTFYSGDSEAPLSMTTINPECSE